MRGLHSRGWRTLQNVFSCTQTMVTTPLGVYMAQMFPQSREITPGFALALSHTSIFRFSSAEGHDGYSVLFIAEALAHFSRSTPVWPQPVSPPACHHTGTSAFRTSAFRTSASHTSATEEQEETITFSASLYPCFFPELL